MTSPAIAPNPKYFKIHGGDAIGAKARSLILNTDSILQAKLRLVRMRNVLDWNIAHDFLKRSGAMAAASDGDMEKAKGLALSGTHSSAEERLFGKISSGLGNAPGKARSSFEGSDAGGNGAGNSSDFLNSPEGVAKAFREVASGYFNEKAVLLRERGVFTGEMGIMLEPLVSDSRARDDCGRVAHAPMLSFYGFTGEHGCKAVLVAGLGNEAMNDPSYGYGISATVTLEDARWKRNHGEEKGRSFQSKASFLSHDGKVKQCKLRFDGLDSHFGGAESWFNGNPEAVFNRQISALHKACGGRRQYFEGAAIRGKNNSPLFFINQIADAEPRYRFEMPQEAMEIIGVNAALSQAGRDYPYYLWKKAVLENGLKTIPLPDDAMAALALTNEERTEVAQAMDERNCALSLKGILYRKGGYDIIERALPSYVEMLSKKIAEIGLIARGFAASGEGEKDAEYFAIEDSWPALNAAADKYEKIILCRWVSPGKDDNFGAGIKYTLPLIKNSAAICWNQTPGGADYLLSHNTGLGALLGTVTISLDWPVGGNVMGLHPWDTLRMAGASKIEGSETGPYGIYKLPMRIFASQLDGVLIKRRD